MRLGILALALCAWPSGAFACPAVAPPDASRLGAARSTRYVVEVLDYTTLRPLAGVEVKIAHQQTCNRNSGCKPTHAHPAAQLGMAKRTDARGRAIFVVPDLDYGFHLPGPAPAGYLGHSTTYDLGAKRCHELVAEAGDGGPRTKYTVTYLVPETLLAVTTDAQATQIADAHPEIVPWLQANPGFVRVVRGGGSAWQVGYGLDSKTFKRLVHINAFDGTAGILGRWL